VGARLGIARVGRHQPLLNGEDEIVSGPDAGRRGGRFAPPEPALELSDGLPKLVRHGAAVLQSKLLYPPEQLVRLRQQVPAMHLGLSPVDVRKCPHRPQADHIPGPLSCKPILYKQPVLLKVPRPSQSA
jgi:hypothetical protein